MKRIALGVSLAIVLVCGVWLLYWAGYARGFAAARHIDQQKRVNDLLVSVSLRDRLLDHDPTAEERCEAEVLIGGQVAEFALKEDELACAIGLRDIVEMRKIEKKLGDLRTPTVEQIRSRFNVSETFPQPYGSL